MEYVNGGEVNVFSYFKSAFFPRTSKARDKVQMFKLPLNFFSLAFELWILFVFFPPNFKLPLEHFQTFVLSVKLLSSFELSL